MDFLLKNKKGINGTNMIEFNISGTVNSYNYWADNSKYLDEFAYNFYTDLFEKIAKDFNYYGNTKFEKEQLIILKQEINYRTNTVGNLHSLQELVQFGEKTSHALNLTNNIEEMWNQQNGHILLSNLKKLGIDLSDLLDCCIKEDRTLWVLGL